MKMNFFRRLCARKVKKYQIGALKDYDGRGNEAKQINKLTMQKCEGVDGSKHTEKLSPEQSIMSVEGRVLT